MSQPLPTSAAFFKGQSDAIKGIKPPRQPLATDAYEEHLYFRVYMQQLLKIQQSDEFRLSMA
jgi:hypothetical protein